LSESAVILIHKAALQLLEPSGMANAKPGVLKFALDSGCQLSGNVRLLFPHTQIENTLIVVANRL